jgi:hypothetical protein
VDDRAVRDPQFQVCAGRPAAVRAHSRTAVPRLLVRVEVEVQERVDPGIDDEDDVTAVAAVAPVRPAERLELLAVDRRAAVPAVPRRHVQNDAVDKGGHGCSLLLSADGWSRRLAGCGTGS